jgi:hypothetical protein
VNTQQPPALAKSLLIGTAGFTTASLVVFGFWGMAGRAMSRAVGEAGFYAACAFLFVVLGPALLKPLARLSFPRFAGLFTGAFLAYALCWCLAWFLVRRRAGEWVGSFAGSFAFCLVLAASFRAWQSLLISTLVFFLAHSAGYFLGGLAYYKKIIVPPQIAWGLFYGLGTGAGIGFAFYRAQRSRPEVTPPRTS